jgi:hypothetical protein
MSFLLEPEGHAKEDLTKELAQSLPRLVGWMPPVTRAGYRRFVRWKQSRKTENQLWLHPMQARIEARLADHAIINFSLLVANFSKRSVEADRLELDSISVGGRNLQRNSDMIKVSGEIPARTMTPLWFDIDLRGSDVSELLRGISKASNAWSSPQASVLIYGRILLLAGPERIKKPVNFTWDWARSNVMNGLGEKNQ